MQEQTESFAEYRARSGMNWSALKHYAKSPAHYLAALANPPAQTPEMQTGSALHALVLEGEAAFASRYAIAPEGDKRRKEVKEAWAAFEAEHAGKEALTPAQNETVRRMVASLLEHPKVAPLLRRCTARAVQEDKRRKIVRRIYADLYDRPERKGRKDRAGESSPETLQQQIYETIFPPLERRKP